MLRTPKLRELARTTEGERPLVEIDDAAVRGM